MSTTELANYADPSFASALERYRSRLDALSSGATTSDEYKEALRAAFEEVTDQRVKDEAKKDILAYRDASRQYTTALESFRSEFGDETKAIEIYRKAPETLDENVRGLVAEIADFREYLRAYQSGDLPGQDSGVTPEQKSAQRTSLGRRAALGYLDRVAEEGIRNQLGVSPMSVMLDALDRRLKSASAGLRKRVEGDPDFRDQLARFSRASEIYTRMAIDRDKRAGDLVALGEAASFPEAQDIIHGWLENAHASLTESRQEIEQQFGKLGRRPRPIPGTGSVTLNEEFQLPPSPRESSDGFIGVLEDILRGPAEAVAPLFGEDAVAAVKLKLPRSDPQAHGSLPARKEFQVGDTFSGEQGADFLPPPRAAETPAIFPMNVQTATEEFSTLMAVFGTQLGVGSAAATGAAGALTRAGAGKVATTALREGTRFGVAEAVNPSIPLEDVKGRAKAGAVGFGLGVAGGTIAGVAGRGGKAAIPKPKVPPKDVPKPAPKLGKPLKPPESAPLKISAKEASFRGPAERFGEKLFRETNIEEAGHIVGGAGGEVGELFAANVPHLATGQGKNKGVLIEFATKGLGGRSRGQVQAHFGKPASRAVFEETGEVEMRILDSSYGQLRKQVLSVTVQPGAKGDKVSNAVLQRALRGWKKETLPDGSIKYTPPAKKLPLKPPKSPEKATLGQLSEAVGAKDPAEKVIEGIKAAKPVRALQEKLFSAERGERIKEAMSALEQLRGRKGFLAAKSKLKGELEKADYESIRGNFTPKEIDALNQRIADSKLLRGFEKIHAHDGLEKLLGDSAFGKGGIVPQNSELKLLGRVFGEKFVRQILQKGGRGKTSRFAEALGVPRTLMATGELSGTLRQAATAGPRHPVLFGRAFKQQLKSLSSEKQHRRFLEEIVAHPRYDKMRRARLALTSFNEGVGLTSVEEELLAANLIERLATVRAGGRLKFLDPALTPGRALGRYIRATNRAYTDLLTKLRMELFTELDRRFTQAGHTMDDEMYRRIAKSVNTFTGRGDLGKFEGAAQELATAIFAPRFWKSRLEIISPTSYWKAHKDPVQRHNLEMALSSVSAGLTVLGAVKAFVPGAEVGTDWRSSDFGKIKIGKTRIDIWAGFIQYPRLLGQLITGESVSATSGRVRKLDGSEFPFSTKEDKLVDFALNKLAPIPSFLRSWLRGKDWNGKPIRVSKEIEERLTPIFIQDLREILKDDPTLAPKLLPLIFFGVGANTFPIEDESTIVDDAKKGVGRAKELIQEKTR